MNWLTRSPAFFAGLSLLTTANIASAQITSVAQLVNAVNQGQPGDVVTVGAGVFELTSPLQPKSGMVIRGSGANATVIRNAPGWQATTTKLPEGGVTVGDVDPTAYLFSLPYQSGRGTHHVTISDMTLAGPGVHGAVYGRDPDGLTLRNLRIRDFMWSGVRTFSMDNARIHDNEFIDAGGRWFNGAPSASSGTTGGGLYLTWTKSSDIFNNRFSRGSTAPERNYYGIKGRQARDTRIHHNTIHTNFSIEFPHENDHRVLIDHNYLAGTVSIPKHGGGNLPTGEDPYTFRIVHNYFKHSYSLEWARNGAEVAYNLFDFSASQDTGNLITNFADASYAPSNGGTRVHDNLIRNPGRGLYASNGHVFNYFEFVNNHVLGATTVTPRTEGMFGFPTATNFGTIVIRDNIFEFAGQPRPLCRNIASYAATLANNRLVNVSDARPEWSVGFGHRGPTVPMFSLVGVNGEWTLDGWALYPTATPEPTGSIATMVLAMAITRRRRHPRS